MPGRPALTLIRQSNRRRRASLLLYHTSSLWGGCRKWHPCDHLVPFDSIKPGVIMALSHIPPSLFSELHPSAHYFLLFPTQLGRLYFYHPAWSLLLFIFPCFHSYFPIMRYSSRLTASDDNSDISTNILDIFSHDASTTRMIILVMTQSWAMRRNVSSPRNTTSKRLNALMFHISDRDTTAWGPRISWMRHGKTGIGEKQLLLNLSLVLMDSKSAFH